MAEEWALRVIREVAAALGYEKLVPIKHAHASGVSYSNIGEEGLEFLENLASMGGRVRVYATFNPAGVVLDPETVKGTSLEEPLTASLEEQWRVIRALLRMGFEFSATCAPYYLRRPGRGEHLAWGESSAVAVANSYFGAATSKEAGPIAVLAALAGYTYYTPIHSEPVDAIEVVVEDFKPRSEVDAGLLGAAAARASRGSVADINLGDWKLGFEALRALEAAFATYSSAPFAGVRGVTSRRLRVVDSVSVSSGDVEATRGELSRAEVDEAEVFFTGCPHHGIGYALHLARKLESTKARGEVWVAVPGYYTRRPWWRRVREYCARRGVRLLPGTCMVVAELGGAVDVVATDSVKAAFYLPRRHGVRVALATLSDWLEARRGRS